MMQMPLSDCGMMSNSIMEFVLNHPEITDVLEAYNKWVVKEQWRAFPWDDPDTPVFCIQMFDVCMHKISRESLDEMWYEEQRILLQSE